MRPYAERKAARIERLRERAAKAEATSQSAYKQFKTISDMIPLGQPILVGHHSERRHRRDLGRIDGALRKSFEAGKQAVELDRRADAAEANDAISSDDPNAVALLREKIAGLERSREHNKEINVTIRTAQRHAKKTGAPWEPIAMKALGDMGVSESTATDLVTPDFCGRIGVPPYQFSNMAGNIRRLELRAKELEARAARAAAAPEVYGSVRVEESENRVRLYFAGKPEDAIRGKLKSNGFRWSPSEGAWQRHASNGAWYEARIIAKLVAASETSESQDG